MLSNKNSGTPRDDRVVLDDVIYRIVVEAEFTKSIETPVIVEKEIFGECAPISVSDGVVVSTDTNSVCRGVENDIFGNCYVFGVPSSDFRSHLKRRYQNNAQSSTNKRSLT